MVRKEAALRKLRSFQRSGSLKLKRMLEIPGRLSHSIVLDHGKEPMDEKLRFLSHGGKSSALDDLHIGSYNAAVDKLPDSRQAKDEKGLGKDKQQSDNEMMKERFAKLLLGEDMSGGGKGVSSALALSNAITNLAASVFGEQSKLEPMSAERKARWKKEVDWLLSVTDYIVEFIPSYQTSEDGTSMEIMVTQQRRDLLVNIPALRKLDAMLVSCLDNFTGNDFWYISKDAEDSEKGVQIMDKWWLPTVKVPPEGLSEESRRNLENQKECVNQVLKASMAINAQILSEMEIPDSYIESLPKNGRSSLGDSVYKNITVDFFDPEQFLSTLDLSSDHTVLDLKDRIEASITIWKRKMKDKDIKSTWGSAISLEKRELFEERAETILLLLKLRFPDIPQSSLDISKIEYNKDVGHSVLESYSRVLESLANTVMTRIDDVLYADALAQDPSLAVAAWKPSPNSTPSPCPRNLAGHDDEAVTPPTPKLSDFLDLSIEEEDAEKKKDSTIEHLRKQKKLLKSATKRFLYIDKIENGQRSPADRH
ncbi:guanyl-nucleotide exchange factor [Lithospermum erythrorhizon]|uniref:Guanyl-nucleotide exchange factor n=1 Tax=Lithospermum erythrorhizon TaxID=34254 RepID=A0AAV3QQ41_LITER